MSTNNDVFKVLVTKGDQEVAALDSPLSALAPGQIGVFDRNTDLAIDGSTPIKDFFIAVGLDKDGDTVTDDMNYSAGQMIQLRNIKEYTYRPHTAAQPMIVKLEGYTAECETEYGIKLEFRNQDVYNRQGYVQFVKPYTYTTGCCDNCDSGCPSGDANEVTLGLIDVINNDSEGLVIAEATARQDLTIATHGTSQNYSAGDVMTQADVEALIVFNEANPGSEVYSDLQITSIPLKTVAFCNINLGYKYPRFTILIPSKVRGFDQNVAGFDCTGTFSIVQNAAAEEGNGYDVQQKEYNSGGQHGNPGPYRTSLSTGVAFNVEYYADKTEKYDQFVLTYDQFSVSGWQEHLNNLATLIAIPATETTTSTGLAAILDGLLAPAGFDALADDVAAADVDPAVVEPTEDKTVDTDGIA
jgi:hypothetical protein